MPEMHFFLKRTVALNLIEIKYFKSIEIFKMLLKQSPFLGTVLS